MELRRVHAQPFRDWDSKDPARDWIYRQYCQDFPPPASLHPGRLPKGDVLSLPSIQCFIQKTSTNFPTENSDHVPTGPTPTSSKLAWHSLWKTKKTLIKRESETKLQAILEDLCRKSYAAFPGLQTDPDAIIAKASDAGDEQGLSLRIIDALARNLQSVWCVFTCGQYLSRFFLR